MFKAEEEQQEQTTIGGEGGAMITTTAGAGATTTTMIGKEKSNPDRYKTIAEVQRALRDSGLESASLCIGVDFTKSNTWTGEKSFGGKSLHEVEEGKMNPYQRVIDILCRTLGPMDEDGEIAVFGFGDMRTTDRSVFSFAFEGEGDGSGERACKGMEEVQRRYEEIAAELGRTGQMSGPTSFVPLIEKAIGIVERTRKYHILIIIADGQVTNVERNVAAIVRASEHALSIVMVGVGDGPWDDMKSFDDQIPQRKFDNFQFVQFNEVVERAAAKGANLDIEFGLAALMEIPDQFVAIRRLGLI